MVERGGIKMIRFEMPIIIIPPFSSCQLKTTKDIMVSTSILADEHYKNLRESGLTDETIIEAGFRTVSVPKWKAASAYAIPYPGIENFYRLRLFNTPKGGGRYDQPAGTPCHLYIPNHVREFLNDPRKPLWITEGEKKCIKASQEGIPCIAVGGWWGWKNKGTDDLLSDFDQITLKGRKVILVPDNDFLSNPYKGINKNIEKALCRFKKALEARGAIVEIKPIPAGPHKGIDNFLCHNTVDRFWTLPLWEPLNTGFALSDLGNAERFIEMHGENVLFWHERGTWLVWDGVRWAEDITQEAITKKAIDTVRKIYGEAEKAESEDRRKAIVAHALKSEGKTRIDAMIGLAQRLVPVISKELDADPYLLNVLNGTVDLREGKLNPHEKDDLITKLAPVKYDPKSECPLWEEFIHKIMNGDEELVSFLKKALGYALTGNTSEQVMFILYGPRGRNGKSTLINTINAIMGDYAKPAIMSTFLIKQGNTIPNDLAMLDGARFVSSIEVKEGRKLDEAVIKQATGNDPITARFLNREFFTYMPQFKIFLAVNHRPVIRGTDDAIWRRIRLIPFNVQIPESEIDLNFSEKLIYEHPGILRWLIEGCVAWQWSDLKPPREVSVATTSYRGDMDVIEVFLGEMCIKGNKMEVPAKQLYSAYCEWIEENNEVAPSARTFNQRIDEKGYGYKTIEGRKVWMGIGLKK